jgi:hypothetical protein
MGAVVFDLIHRALSTLDTPDANAIKTVGSTSGKLDASRRTRYVPCVPTHASLAAPPWAGLFFGEGNAIIKNRLHRADLRSLRVCGVLVRIRHQCHSGCALMPILNELRVAGVTTLRGIVTASNQRGTPTAAGRGGWQAAQVPGVAVVIEQSK